MKIFVVRAHHSRMRGSWSEYYLVFAEDENKALEKAKSDCTSERGMNFSIEQEIEQGETSFLYDDSDRY